MSSQSFVPVNLVPVYQKYYIGTCIVSPWAWESVVLLTFQHTQVRLEAFEASDTQRPLDEGHVEELSSIWGESLSTIQNSHLDHAIHVVALAKGDSPPFTSDTTKEAPDSISGQYTFSGLSGQHRVQVLLKRLQEDRNLSSRKAAVLEDEAVWMAHIYSPGMSSHSVHDFNSHLGLDLLGKQDLCSALMVVHNTPIHLKQSTVLEKVNAFIGLTRMESITSEELEAFYAHIRGSITSNFLLECAFPPALAYEIECLSSMKEVEGIPQSTLQCWTRAGPNQCHAAGASVS